MDPRDRADAALARARARGAFVVTPDDAVSPMDAKNTQQIPRAVVNALDTSRQDSDTTMVISAGMARGHGHPVPQQPPQQHPHQPQQPPQQPISPALLEETRTQPVQVPAQQPTYRPEPQQQPEPQPAPRALDGLVPTVQQPANPRSTLSRRLEGD
ncbi:MAG TPA: hypothetical protein VG247_32895 [Pseudonocardiaceae bacterium]|jgi:hypothetical protein|nr:hypothetical protein [Pseudonocardiaceae bacterium]